MGSYVGFIYDLDFIDGNDWCQALILKKGDKNNIVVVTSDLRMQSILQTAFLMSHEVEVEYEDKEPFRLTRAKINIDKPAIKPVSEKENTKNSNVIETDITPWLMKIAEEELSRYNLYSVEDELLKEAAGKKVPYKSAKVFEYAQKYCSGGNDCPDGSFPLDCTHFMCHCLKATGINVTDPSTKCKRGLCIRVNDLAVAFKNSVKTYENVTQITSHAQTKRGDFCFIPGWFGLSKEHVMLLADTASSAGARVFAHTNNRCGNYVPFEGEDSIYYRIEDF